MNARICIFAEMFQKFYKMTIPFYTVFLLYLMFVGFGRSQYDTNIVRLVPMFSTIDFVTETIRWKTIIINLFGNVIMFAPFGCLGLVFPALNGFKTLIVNFLFVIILVESLQYFTRLGVFDVDDIILNTLGVAIGFWIYKLMNLDHPSARI
ncbi:VanZ family protein [Epilithonimonas tenax]|uniref:VanZ family protein n=1 Tax=Epilithonimonas tenax TaxID=191577 RepID=UPI00293472EA|nr:VanZ family protein [Epilithonimonas tenax]